MDEELDLLLREGPTAAELARPRGVRDAALARLEKVGTVADLMNHYRLMAGDADYIDKDLARYRALTPQAVQAVAAKLLQRQARVVVHALPGTQVLAAEVPTPPGPPHAATGEREAINADQAWRHKPPFDRSKVTVRLPVASSFKLANGLTVLHSPKPGVPLVSAELVLRAGQSANPLAQPGLAGFTAAMLQEGTRARSAQDIAAQLADLGASFASHAGRDDARLELGSLKSAFEPALTLLADMALNPAFDAAEVERVKKTRLAALLQQRENASQLATVVAARAYYGAQHPLGASALGTEQSVAAIDRDALVSFWQTHYRADQAALVVAGDISEAQLRELAQRLFGNWAPPAVAGVQPAQGLPALAAPTDARLVVVNKADAPQTALVLVGPGSRAGQPDEQSLEVMNAALGGLFTSRINTQLREVKGYTYGVSSGYVFGRDGGHFSLRGSVRADVTGAALADTFREIKAMRAKAMGRTELERVRNALLLSLPGQFDTNAAITEGYGRVWTLGLPQNHIEQLPAALQAVTARSASKAALDHLDPSRLIVVAVGDQPKVASQLRPGVASRCVSGATRACPNPESPR
ncbi:MAG: insulinase family protein [Rhodoferax sp.]|nr:insulinase family protein [Rhodoferax sp.]